MVQLCGVRACVDDGVRLVIMATGAERRSRIVGEEGSKLRKGNI
jgi:hypothetical protein